MDYIDKTTLKRGITLDVSTCGSSIINICISNRGQLAFMQIKKVAQGRRLGNQAEFVPRPHMKRNQWKTSPYRTFPGPPLDT